MKNIIITGATSGIGRAAAIVFAEAGFQLGLTARRARKLDDLASALKEQFKIKCHTYALTCEIKPPARLLPKRSWLTSIKWIFY